MEVVAGREAKRTMRERASSRSRRESVKVGYLQIPSAPVPPCAPRYNSPLLDNVVNAVHGLGLLEVLGESVLASSQSPRQLLRKRLVLPQLSENRLVEEVLDVLGVVERGRGGGALVGLFAGARLTRVDAWKERGRGELPCVRPTLAATPKLTLEDTQPTEVSKRALELLHRLVTGDVLQRASS